MVLLEFQCPTTQVRLALGLLPVTHSAAANPGSAPPAVRGDLPQPAPDAGQSQAEHQGGP